MIPVDQTRSGAIDGNCLEACIASILELPLEAVPDLACRAHDGTDGEHWMEPLTRFARIHGYAVAYVTDAHLRPRGHHIACGPSDAGGHAVVALDGRIVHCPHPSRLGFRMPVTWWLLFLPLRDFSAEAA